MGTPGRDDDDDVDRVGIGDDYNDVEEEEEDPEEEEFDEDPDEIYEEEEDAGGEELGNSVEVGVDAGEDLQEAEEVEEEEEEEEVQEGEDLQEAEEAEEEEEVAGSEEFDEEQVNEEVEDDEDEEEGEVELENNVEDVEKDSEVEMEEDDEVDMENNEEDVENEDEELEGDAEEDEVELENNGEDVENYDEVEEDEEGDEEGEVELENNEEILKNGDEVKEDDKPSILPIISSEKDATGNESEDAADIKPLNFAKAEPLKNENVDCGYETERVNEMESHCGNKDTSQLLNKTDANDIGFYAMRGVPRGCEVTESLNTDTSISVDSGALYNQVNHMSDGNTVKEVNFDAEKELCQLISNKDAEDIDVCAGHGEPKRIEAVEFLSTDPPIHLEAEPVRNENADCTSACMGVTRMGSDCEEEDRHINNKVAQPVYVYAPSIELKCTSEAAKTFSTAGLDLELNFMQEGGVEDMDLDSEENVVHGSDVNGTVVDSIQENLAFNSHQKGSFSAGANASNIKTVVAGNAVSSSSGGKDPKEHTSLKPSSMAATPGKERSLPPATQLTDMNKRTAITCSYYAKGWCVKGNLCRFLHVKEKKDNTYEQQVPDLASVDGKKQESEGVGDSFKIRFPEQHAKSHMHQLNNKLGCSPLEPRLLHSAKPDFGFGVVESSSALASRLMPNNVNATLFNDPLQSIANRYINQHLHPTAPTDVFSSRYISPVIGSSNSVVSLNSNPYDALKISSGNIDFNTSSSSLGLKSQRGLLNSLGLAPEAEMHKWEPSKPFRPSYYFSIPSGSSPGGMYDPLRDSIEHSSLGIGSFRAELINYPSNQSYPDSGRNNFEMDGYHGTVPDRYDHSRVTGLLVTDVEAAESSVADQGNFESAPGGDKGSGTSHGNDRSDRKKTNTVSAEKKRKLREEKIHRSGVDVDTGLDTNDQRESKSLRQFRVAVIDFTKELLKPAWRVGKLSKDAHNLIVKKTVTKVLSSLHSHQIPSTPDLVRQYLSESQPKITKLLEAYVQKHNKT